MANAYKMLGLKFLKQLQEYYQKKTFKKNRAQ